MSKKYFFLFFISLLFVACKPSGKEGNQDKSGAVPEVKPTTQQEIERITQQIQANPKQYHLYKKRSELYYQIDSVEKAIADIEKAMEYAAADSVADMYYLRGFYAFAKNDTATAMKQLKQAFKMLKSYPNAEVPYQMGTMFLLQKNYPSAHQYIELSIRMDSSSAIYPFANGYVYQQEKKYEEAIQWYLQAIRKNSTLAKPYLQLYEIYANELKDKQKALSINEKLLTINPKHPLANYHKANDVYQKGMESTDEKVMKENLAGAAVLYAIAIQADEKFVNAYYARGLSYFFMDAEEEAMKDFEKTLQLNPQHANAHFQLGSIFEHHQDLITALQHYEAAAAIQPDFKDALQAVKELKAKMGN